MSILDQIPVETREFLYPYATGLRALSEVERVIPAQGRTWQPYDERDLKPRDPTPASHDQGEFFKPESLGRRAFYRLNPLTPLPAIPLSLGGPDTLPARDRKAALAGKVAIAIARAAQGLAAAIVALALSGCGPSYVSPIPKDSDRIKLTQRFFGDSAVIRDTQTGREYILNGGGGIIEIESSK